MAPIDAAKFDAHKNINTVIIQFLCHNKGKGFSAKEIAERCIDIQKNLYSSVASIIKG